LEKTAAFYTAGLGLKKAFDFEKEGRLFGFYLQCGRDSYIEVFQGSPGQPGSIIHLCLEVDSIDTVIAHLEGVGIAVTPKKKGADGNYQAWLEDPNGVKIELMEYGPDCCQKTGRTCLVNW